MWPPHIHSKCTIVKINERTVWEYNILVVWIACQLKVQMDAPCFHIFIKFATITIFFTVGIALAISFCRTYNFSLKYIFGRWTMVLWNVKCQRDKTTEIGVAFLFSRLKLGTSRPFLSNGLHGIFSGQQAVCENQNVSRFVVGSEYFAVSSTLWVYHTSKVATIHASSTIKIYHKI